MVRHIVCYKLKDPTDEVKQKTKEIFLSMQGRVPEVKSVTVGIDELHSESERLCGFYDAGHARLTPTRAVRAVRRSGTGSAILVLQDRLK